MRLLMLVVAAFASGCATLGPANYRSFEVDVTRSYDLMYRGLPLRSGDFIVSDEGEAETLLFSLIGDAHSSFVHSGIVSIERGRPYVYEAYATVHPFGQQPPTDTARGGIQRVTLEHYLQRQRISAVFTASDNIDRTKVVSFAQARYRDGTAFDPYFNWLDHDALYCTEFVALALHEGGASLPVTTTIRRNPSLQVALDWLKVAAKDLVTADALTVGAQRVALISRRDSPIQIAAYFAAKRELHARFTADQKLGNIWRWTWRGLALQPQVAAFIDAARQHPEQSTKELTSAHFDAPSISD